MEHITLILVAALTLLGAAFSKLLADEFKAWAPSLVSSIIAIAVRALPPSRRDRAAEEWRSHVDELPGDLSKVIVSCGFVFAAWKIAGKPQRIVDFSTALVTLFILLPLLVIFYAATVVTSPGPGIIRQRRSGPTGKPVYIYKFRTLALDAEKRLLERLESDPAAAAEWAANGKLQDDPRLTRIGRILRRSNLEEIPQLFNVLKGDANFDSRPLLKELALLALVFTLIAIAVWMMAA